MTITKRLVALAIPAVLLASPAWSGDAFVPDKTVARNKIVNWLQQNDKGPDFQFIQQVANAIDREIHRCNNMNLLVGQDTTKSGSAYSIDAWAGAVFVTELTDEQAAKMGVKRNSVTMGTGAKALDRKLSNLPLTIKEVTIDQAERLAGDKKVTGRLTVDAVGAVPQKFAVRLSYMSGNTTVSKFFHYDGSLSGGNATINFSLSEFNRPGDRKVAGPVIVFVELAMLNDRGTGNIDVTICSNTIALMLEVAGNN
jgi:hypothetical protein